MKLFLNEKLFSQDFDAYSKGKNIDGRFYESLREFEKFAGGDPETFQTRWDNGDFAIKMMKFAGTMEILQ